MLDNKAKVGPQSSDPCLGFRLHVQQSATHFSQRLDKAKHDFASCVNVKSVKVRPLAPTMGRNIPVGIHVGRRMSDPIGADTACGLAACAA